MSQYEEFYESDDETEYEPDYDNTIVHHSVPRIVTTTVLLALLTGVFLTVGIEFFSIELTSKREILRIAVFSYLPLFIALIFVLSFLRYAFKSTKRFLY